MYNQQSMFRLRWVLRFVTIATGLVSVGINMLHANLGGNVVSVGLAPIAPVVVIASAEIMGRFPGDPRWPWYKKWIRPTVMTLIAIGGAWVSYWAQSGAIMYYSSNWQEAHILPLLVDGFMVINTYTVYLINDRLMAIELAKQGKEIKLPTPASKTKALSKKEQVAILLGNNPTMSDGDIAKRVGASYSYVNTLTKELKQLNGAELNGALKPPTESGRGLLCVLALVPPLGELVLVRAHPLVVVVHHDVGHRHGLLESLDAGHLLGLDEQASRRALSVPQDVDQDVQVDPVAILGEQASQALDVGVLEAEAVHPPCPADHQKGDVQDVWLRFQLQRQVVQVP